MYALVTVSIRWTHLDYCHHEQVTTSFYRVSTRKAKSREGSGVKGMYFLVLNLSHSQLYNTILLPQPKFLTKEERAKIAIAKRAEEIRDQREKEESQKKEREQFEREAEAIRAKERAGEERSRYGRGSRCQ